MTGIGFIGLGNMGGPMARKLIAADHAVAGFDVVASALGRAVGDGAAAAASVAALSIPARSSSSSRAIRMPRPPPPADAFTMTG
mgnify:CR=1 FL=1